MCDTIIEPNHDLTTCPYFLEEYDRVQDSLAINSTSSDTLYESTNTPWYTEYNPLVYLGVFVLILVIRKIRIINK